MTEPRDKSRRTSRLWVVPPGLASHDEPFDGFHVLDEVRSELGVALWQALRDADLWSTSPPEQRPRLLAPGTAEQRAQRLLEIGAERGVRAPLEALGRALESRSPRAAEQVSQACHAVSRWAADAGLPRTALAFAQSAAFAVPDRAAAAYLVGMLARRHAEYRRAETWYRRSLALGRRGRDWKYYALACLGLGNLHKQRGDYPTARAWYFRSLRVARRHGLWQVRPMALHDLFCVAANGGQVDDAETWARRAFRSYGRRHPRLVALAHDVARFWLNQGRYDEAISVFRAVLPHVRGLGDRRLIISNTARATAGTGNRMAFAALWSDTWRLVDDSEDTERVAEALITLAEGAAALSDHDRAQMAANQALRVATIRGEAEQKLAAERLLEALRTPRGAAAMPPPVARPDDPRSEAFANDLVDALTAELAVDFTES